MPVGRRAREVVGVDSRHGPIGPGTKWKSVDRVGPFVVEFTDELIELEPNRSVAFKQSSPWNSWGGYQLEPDGDDTVVQVRFEGKLSGKIRWMDLMADPWATRIFRKDMQRLGRFLDSKNDAWRRRLRPTPTPGRRFRYWRGSRSRGGSSPGTAGGMPRRSTTPRAARSRW